MQNAKPKMQEWVFCPSPTTPDPPKLHTPNLKTASVQPENARENHTPTHSPTNYTTNPLVCLKSLTLISRQTNTAPMEMT